MDLDREAPAALAGQAALADQAQGALGWAPGLQMDQAGWSVHCPQARKGHPPDRQAHQVELLALLLDQLLQAQRVLLDQEWALELALVLLLLLKETRLGVE